MANAEIGQFSKDFEAAQAVVQGWLKPEVQPEKKPESKQSLVNEPVKPEEEAPAEKPEEESAVAEAEETAPEETSEGPIKAEARRFKLKYKGEEIEKDEPEVITLAQQGFDYTQKSQALARERSEIHEKIKSQTEPALQAYQQKLQLYERALWQALAPEVNSTDWNALARDDPGSWAQRMQQVTNVNNVLQAVQRELAAISEKQQMEQKTARESSIAETREALERDLPGWSDELYQKILRSGVSDYGFKPEEVGTWIDPRAIKVLHDAMKYRALVKTKPEMEKRVALVPKVIKPGTAQDKPDAKAERFNKAMANLKKTGRTDEAVEVARMLVE